MVTANCSEYTEFFLDEEDGSTELYLIYLEIVLSIKRRNKKHGGFDVTISDENAYVFFVKKETLKFVIEL